MAAKKDEQKKLTIGQKIKKELQHYWDGTKLLATEVRISSKLALKMSAGYELTRRENRQVQSCCSQTLFERQLTVHVASTHRPRSWPPCSLFRFRHSPICRTSPTRGTQAVPQHAAQHL